MAIRYNPHRDVWLREKGGGPWPCEKCGEQIESMGGEVHSKMGIVHHSDENPRNNDIVNLRAMHHGCHISYHNGRRVRTDESRARASAAQKKRRASEPPEVRDKFVRSGAGKKPTAEVRAKIGAARSGKTLSEEARRKISESLKGNKNMLGRPVPEETRRKIAETLRGRKHTPEAIENITAANQRIARTRRPRAR